MSNKAKIKSKGVKEILLMGVFWRILIIEGILLVGSLIYEWHTKDADTMDLFWYSVRITGLVIIIIAFMMMTLKDFLTRSIIEPLQSIALANEEIQEDYSNMETIALPQKPPHEIETIITTRSKMLKRLFDVSEERLKYSKALDEELERGKKIQKDFLPRYLPDVKNCDISSYFHPALQLSGDFYDMFELPNNHVGFVVGDVSGKGVGAALFMALVRSLLRIFSGGFNTESDLCSFSHICKDLTPEDALKAVFLTNEYMAEEHGDDGMFVTLFFGVIDPESGRVFYVNGGHEPVMIIGENGIKQMLKATGPALGPIKEAVYEIGTHKLEKGDILFCYTDGVTEARSETKGFYTRSRLEKTINQRFNRSSGAFLETIKEDLLSFTGKASQSDDITMLAIQWSA